MEHISYFTHTQDQIFSNPLSMNYQLNGISFNHISDLKALEIRKAYGSHPDLANADEFDKGSAHIEITKDGKLLAYLRIISRLSQGILPFEKDHVNGVAEYDPCRICIGHADIELSRLIVVKKNLVGAKVSHIEPYIQSILQEFSGSSMKIWIAAVNSKGIKIDRYLRAGFQEASMLTSDYRYLNNSGTLLFFQG